MKLDRDLQREILLRLQSTYPAPDWKLFDALGDGTQDRETALIANLTYLIGHGLIDNDRGLQRGADGHYAYSGVNINSKGLDFLEDDGGLSAILGVVTIKIHNDTIKSLIESRIQESDLSPHDKRRLLDRLQSLPADSIKHLTEKLLDKALENTPLAIAALGTWMAHWPS